MQKIKICIFCIFVLCSKTNVYPIDISNINGTWIPHWLYEEKVKTPNEKYLYNKRKQPWGMATTIPNSSFNINLTGKEQNIVEPGLGLFEVSNIQITKNNEIIVHVFRGNKNEPDMLWKRTFIFHIVDMDTIWIEYDNIKMTDLEYGKDAPWHRLSGPAKIPVQNGTINDNRVRLRVKPNLSSDTWGFLNNGDEVRIIDRSPNTQKIDNTEAHWYKVQTNDKPDGWVYGAYIDITE
jgi:uncharacterized protein YgiM (DUF1202 family)